MLFPGRFSIETCLSCQDVAHRDLAHARYDDHSTICCELVFPTVSMSGRQYAPHLRLWMGHMTCPAHQPWTGLPTINQVSNSSNVHIKPTNGNQQSCEGLPIPLPGLLR